MQSLNELTIRELVARGHKHQVLQNMHLGQTQVNYDAWLADQRRRYARALSNPDRLAPNLEHETADDKTYLITGASGIGAETAKQLVQAERGATRVQLFIAAREEDRAARPSLTNCGR